MAGHVERDLVVAPEQVEDVRVAPGRRVERALVLAEPGQDRLAQCRQVGRVSAGAGKRGKTEPVVTQVAQLLSASGCAGPQFLQVDVEVIGDDLLPRLDVGAVEALEGEDAAEAMGLRPQLGFLSRADSSKPLPLCAER